MRTKAIVFGTVLLLIAGTALALTEFRIHQRLGEPGIKADPIPGEVRMRIQLPEKVADFDSTNVPESDLELNYFPGDTSYARRCYFSPDGAPIFATIVMMGADRTSIHKPDYCLPGQGWTINRRERVAIPVAGGGYDLPVSKWTISNSVRLADGTEEHISGLYVFWFVARNEETPSHYQRLWWLTRDLLRTGVLQRWAYVSYFAACAPGQEAATFERMKKLIGHSVADFQLPPRDKEVAGKN